MTDYKDEIEAANERAAAQRKNTPIAIAAHYDARIERVVIDLSTGLSIMFKPHDAQGLENAKPEHLAKIEISPSGFGIHFPALDADLYLPSLLEGFMGSRKWMAAQLGKTGGGSSSAAKKAASRTNGKMGGRPKKRTPHVADVAYGHLNAKVRLVQHGREVVANPGVWKASLYYGYNVLNPGTSQI